MKPSSTRPAWRAPRTTWRDASCASTTCPCSSRAAPRRRPRHSGLVAPARGGAARRGRPACGRAEVGSPFFADAASRGRDLAGSPRRSHPRRGGRPPREAGVVRGRVAVDASRPDGEVRLAGRKLLRQALWITLSLVLLAAASFMPAATSCSGGGPPGCVSGGAAARGGRHPLLGPRGHHVADWGAESSLASRGAGLVVLERPSCGCSTSRSSRTRGGCAPGPWCRGPGSSAAGSATRWSGRTRSSASPGPCSVRSRALPHVLPALFGQPPPDLMSGYLDPAHRRRPLWLDLGMASNHPLLHGACCSSSSRGCSCGGTPWPPRPSSCSCSPRRAAGESRCGSRCLMRCGRCTGSPALRFGLLAAIVGLFPRHDLLVALPPHPDVTPGRPGRAPAPGLSSPSSRCWPREAPRGTRLRRYLRGRGGLAP